MTVEDQENIHPKRTIGLLAGTLYGIGCGIGGSIFILLGSAISHAKAGILISLILGGILIFFTALNYSELSTSLPISGGGYNFSKEALGGFLAFIIGFFLWIANIATFSFSAQAFGIVIQEFFNLPFSTPFTLLIALISISFISIVVFRTHAIALRSLLSLTVIQIIIFVIFIFVGLVIAPNANFSSFNPDFLKEGFSFNEIIFVFASTFIFFTTITSNLAYLNADLKTPSKNIPKVNILAILITLIIYLLTTFAVLINLGNHQTDLGESPILLALILEDIMSYPGYLLMGLAAMISTLIAMNAAIGSAISVFHALARDHYVSKKFLKVNKRTNVPTLILTLTTLITISFTILALLFANIGLTANITIFIYFIGIAFINYAAVSLRRKRKELDRPFKAPFFPYLPIILMSVCLILALFLDYTAIILGLIIFFIGITYYLLTIADRNSITLTLAGLKFFMIIILGIIIWVINNMAVLMSPLNGFDILFQYILMRILIFIDIFAIGTLILDIFPLKEFVYYFVKKVNKKEVAIDIGIGQIIELKKFKVKLIYNINLIIGVIQVASSIFIFTLISLFLTDSISIECVLIGGETISENTAEYITISVFSTFSVILLLSGALLIYYNQELKKMGI